MDIFVEQLIKRKIKLHTALLNVLLSVTMSLIIIEIIKLGIIIPSMTTVSFFLCLIIILTVIKLIKNQNIEFEYIITNNNLTVDKIINKRKRKHIIDVDLKSINKIGLYSSDKNVNGKIIKCCIDEMSNSTWFINFRNSNHGNMILLISPNEKILQTIKPFLRGQCI